jgi:hypothetical protein
MLYQLCKEFPAFTPLQLENERYHKVIALYADTKKVQMRYEKQKAEAETQPHSGVIRRPAGDTWF